MEYPLGQAHLMISFITRTGIKLATELLYLDIKRRQDEVDIMRIILDSIKNPVIF